VPHESGPRIVIPLYILAFLALFSGFLNFPPGFQLVPSGWQARFEHYVEPQAATGYFPAIAHATPSWSLAIVSTLLVLSGVALAWNYYFRRVNAQSPAATELTNGLVSRNRLVVYNHIDQPIVDGAVNLAGRGSSGIGGGLRRLQTGKVQQYAGLMFAAAAVLAGLIIVFV